MHISEAVKLAINITEYHPDSWLVINPPTMAAAVGPPKKTHT